MDNNTTSTLQTYNRQVALKFQLYNSLFTALPFHRVEKTGVLLSIFLIHCEEGYENGKSPKEIIESFLEQYTSYRTTQEQNDLLFRFVQYAERQVVLFDALEDSSFRDVNDMNGPGTLKQLQSEVTNHQSTQEFKEKLKDFNVRLVLTAHPTQFYPSEVLGIIHDLSRAIIKDNTAQVNSYLRQLGKTPFFKKEKPTPYDEAINLIWYLQNVFYQASGQIMTYLKNNFPDVDTEKNPLFRLGFWPGGDRDGNPFVTSDTTLKVAEALRRAVLNVYYGDIQKLKRRLTFKGVQGPISKLEEKLYNNLYVTGYQMDITKEEMLSELRKVRTTLIEEHTGLFQGLIENFIRKVELFGLFFASLDIRQDSSVHTELLELISKETDLLPENFGTLSEKEKIELLLHPKATVETSITDNELFKDTLNSIQAVKTIQKYNGEQGCHRYIISHSTNALDVMSVYGLFRMRGWQAEEMMVDIVPLFESIEDLKNAAGVMQTLYELPEYREHLARRNHTQTIMLGFSDGTKDGGYLMANWSIYRAKEELSKLSKKYDIEVVFFDGRGGPPARGGGRTHQFYASMGPDISKKEIQLTIQGQTISSNFGTVDSAQFNIEQLMHAGIRNSLFPTREASLNEQDEALIQQLSEQSFEAYNELKQNPDFLEYLNFASPLKYYGQANIGSRPSKRKPGKLNLDDLRAVPYVGSWSQLKQNLPGYYGVGIAFEKMEADGRWEEVMQLYENSLFFKTLISNCEMAMTKSFFPLTAYLADHPKFGGLWEKIYEEFNRTKKYVMKLNNADELMADKPINQLSIKMRQRIELPLLTIQQYALTQIREIEEKSTEEQLKEVYEKMVVRCSFGIINAERNSA